MERYIIKNIDEKMHNAGSKARRDIATIATKLGYQDALFCDIPTAEGSLALRIRMAVSCIINGLRLVKKVSIGGEILIQYPQFPIKSSYFLCLLIPWARRRKNLKFVALIHDMDSLRGFNGKAGIYCDTKVLPLMDAVICHNASMKKQLIKLGIGENKVTELGLFDYLTDAVTKTHSFLDGITIAGNLDPQKCGYISGLIDLATFPVHLYGSGISLSKASSSYTYHGSFSPEELPGVIEGGFGLVWDGDSTEACSGPTGEYLKYNNPHKLSLYLVSGMPVIVWEYAAVADFVRRNNLGFSVGKLSEIGEVINKMSIERYESMRKNVLIISEKLRKGCFLESAINKLDEIL